MGWFNKLMAKWGLAEDKSGLWHMWQGDSSTCSMFATAHCAQAMGVHVTRKQVFELFDKANARDGNPTDGMTPINVAMDVAVEEGWFETWKAAWSLDDIQFPCVLATPWHTGMEYVRGDGLMSAEGRVMSNHAVMLKEKNQNGSYVIHNSVGTAWGDGGDGYLSEADLVKLLAGNASLVIPKGKA